MNKVIVNVQNEYTVSIGSDLLQTIGSFIPPEYDSSQVAIITDDNVAKLYLNIVINGLEAAGIHPFVYIFTNGESSKNLTTCTDIINFLTNNHFRRCDLIIALGGGNVLDIVGFCSSIYLCSIDYISLPTTLDGMIDTSVGGKNTINTPLGKNIVGTLYHPKAVICDVSTLDTIPDKQLRNGIAQSLKYAAIYDKQIFGFCKHNMNKSELTALITRLVRIKTFFVCGDEFDKGSRIILNFGHTIGNIIELYHNGKIPYGEALAMGMAMITKLSEKYGLSKPGTYRYLVNEIADCKFDTSCKIPLSFLLKHVTHDVKYNNDTLRLILLKEIGKPYIFNLKKNKIQSFFDGTFHMKRGTNEKV